MTRVFSPQSVKATPGRVGSEKLIRVFIALFSLALASAGAAQSEEYPTRTISLVAPSTAGSTPDVLSRLIASELSKRRARKVIVLNRAGAGTNLGTARVAHAAPDGSTLLLGSIANTLNP